MNFTHLKPQKNTPLIILSAPKCSVPLDGVCFDLLLKCIQHKLNQWVSPVVGYPEIAIEVEVLLFTYILLK